MRLTVAEDGEQAVECLLREGRYAGNPSADLIFLDMHLPLFDGLEVLRKVPGSALLPVCMLTNSEPGVRTYARAFRETDWVSD
jgi:DNA-binding response OmpR family regulator